MAIDFKNIQFKYVKITGGASTIDVTMDDNKFSTNKPNGYYKVFVFPASVFAGYDYEDLQNLVSIEEKDIWDKTNRDTFLGYNEESNKFICNISAYMGLKDSDLKTDGNIDHPGQAGWYEMDLSTTNTDSIINLKQINGSNVYLKIAQENYKDQLNLTSFGNTCVVNTKKKISETPILIKNSALWTKSDEDNSAIMVMDNTVISSARNFSYVNSNRLMQTDANYQTLLYGKPVIYFANASDQKITSVTSFNSLEYIKNTTGKEFVEYTETSDLNDILNSDEYLTFKPDLKNKYARFCKSGTNNIKAERIYRNGSGSYAYSVSSSSNFESYSTPKIEGLPFDLISHDPKNKPFIYISNNGEMLLNGNINSTGTMKPSKFITNLQDGFIACSIFVAGSSAYMYRFKNGDPVKKRMISSGFYPIVSGATGFGNALYGTGGGSIPGSSITKNDLINGTSFSNVSESEIAKTRSNGEIPCVTIYKI